MKFDEFVKADYQIHDRKHLDQYLVKLCHLIVVGQHHDPERFGMVAAAILDPDHNLVARTSMNLDGKWEHAERCAMEAYEREYGEIPEGSILITTLSPCSDDMADRYKGSCTDLINDSIIRKVYCGYMDPSQHHEHNDFTEEVTKNKHIQRLCKKFAFTFLGDKKHPLEETNFKKPYYTLIINDKSVATSNQFEKLHQLAKDYKKENPNAKIKVKSSEAVDEVRTIGLYNPQTQKKQYRVVYANNKPVTYFSINEIGELKALLDYMKEKHPNVKVEVKKEYVSEEQIKELDEAIGYSKDIKTEGNVITLPIVHIKKAADLFKGDRMMPPINDEFSMDLLTRQIIRFLLKNPMLVDHIPANELPKFAHDVAVYLVRRNKLPVREAANAAQQAAIAINMKKNHKKPKSEEYDYGNMHGVAEIPKALLKHGWTKKSINFDKTVFVKKGVGLAKIDRNESGFVRFTIKGRPYTTYGHKQAIELLNKLDPLADESMMPKSNFAGTEPPWNYKLGPAAQHKGSDPRPFKMPGEFG